MRTDEAVTRELGRAITARVLELNPDLVAVRPLVESVATAVGGQSGPASCRPPEQPASSMPR